MVSKNKFGFDAVPAPSPKSRKSRSVGPMGAAVREAAESLQEATDAKVAQRRQNAEDAKAFRAASDAGLLLVALPLVDVSTSELPRDRLDLEAVAASDEMEELKSSIRLRGQKEPIEVFRGQDGALQLKKGWRRLTALTQLFNETGDEAFSTVMARVENGQADRMARYVDMVEENVVREDLTFAEMAQVAVAAAADPSIEGDDAEALVGRLYGALHKMKRSYIRSFVALLAQVGDVLQWPKSVSRNLGVDVARALKADPSRVEGLRASLAACATEEAQGHVLASFVSGPKIPKPSVPTKPKQKVEFHVGDVKVTARDGECRIVSKSDYASLPNEVLAKAIRAFEAALKDG